MRLHKFICGCFLTPKTSGEVQADSAPQGVQADVVLKPSGIALLERVGSGDACSVSCVAKDSVDTSQHGSRRSKTGGGLDYLYAVPYGRSSLSSRALVGGVEYYSFFVNPIAEGSHEEGSPIPYAGAAIKSGDVGLHNPLAEEFTNYSSPPDSPTYAKIITFARSPCDFGACADTTAPAAPSTPSRSADFADANQGFLPLDNHRHDRQEEVQQCAPVQAQDQQQQEQPAEQEEEQLLARQALAGNLFMSASQRVLPLRTPRDAVTLKGCDGSCHQDSVEVVSPTCELVSGQGTPQPSTPSLASSPALLTPSGSAAAKPRQAAADSNAPPSSPPVSEGGSVVGFMTLEEPLAPSTPPLAAREVGVMVSPGLELRVQHQVSDVLAGGQGVEKEQQQQEEAGARQLLEQCGSAHVPELGRFSLGAAGERSFSESLRRVQSLDGLRHSEGQTMERCEPLQLPLPICGAAQQQLECPQLLKSGEPLEEFQQKLQSPELLESPADAVQHREPAESPELLESQQLEGSQQQLKESQQQLGVSFEVVPTGCVEAPVSVCGRSVSSCGCPCTGACSCVAAAMTSSRGSSLGGTNSRGSSLGGAGDASTVANSRGSSLGGAAGGVSSPGGEPTDPGCSISALAMTRLLIRQLGLIPCPIVADECLEATQASCTGDAAPPLLPFAAACRTVVVALQSDWYAGSATSGVQFARVRVTGGGAPKPMVVQPAATPLLEEEPVEESVAAPLREEAVEEVPSEHDGENAGRDLDRCDSYDGCQKTELLESSDSESWAESDDVSSIASTRTSSMVEADRQLVSMKSWLEPQGWKPLREKFCGLRPAV